jgi:hypothetical protein
MLRIRNCLIQIRLQLVLLRLAVVAWSGSGFWSRFESGFESRIRIQIHIKDSNLYRVQIQPKTYKILFSSVSSTGTALKHIFLFYYVKFCTQQKSKFCIYVIVSNYLIYPWWKGSLLQIISDPDPQRIFRFLIQPKVLATLIVCAN